MSGKNSYLAITKSQQSATWLTDALASLGDVVAVSEPKVEHILQLADSVPASAVFLEMDPKDYQQEIAVMQGLITAQPLLPVFVIGNEINQDMLLAAMRVGARDFIKTGTTADAVTAAVQRWASFEPGIRIASTNPVSHVTAVVSARPCADSAMLAMHLALAVEESGPSLLLDLGVPQGDAAFFLGLSPNFSFIDALNNLHHLDATLIETGFEKHKSGLTVLSLPDEPWSTDQVSSADIYMLMHIMRKHFAHIVVNLGGSAQSGLLSAMLANCDQILLLIEQTLPSCRQNIQLLKRLREEKIALGHAGVVIDRYLPKLKPDATSLANSFELPLLSVLPPCGMARIATMNSGISMFELTPNSPYAMNVRKLARFAVNGDTEFQGQPLNLWRRLMLALFPYNDRT